MHEHSSLQLMMAPSDAGNRHSVYGYREMGFQATDFKILDISCAGIGDVAH
jgi:hypothetical protein